ncbi:hypothetical protein HQ529_02635 [Candidatus Woesearchaeota archaeon]|nr:hypothetical protein [Candidatus Woesearchaeota archaeon]
MVDYTFGVSDGTRLNNLHDLARALEFMSEHTYKSHVNETKNDFSGWVHEVLGIEGLAVELKDARNQFEAEILVLEHILRIAKQRANQGHD